MMSRREERHTVEAKGSGATPRAVVLGGSAGSLSALIDILKQLPQDYPLPLVVVVHLHSSDGGGLARYLDDALALRVVEAEDKTSPAPGHVYVCSANYHLLMERDGTLSLSVDERVNWSRPSIDVLFESAARAWDERLHAVILSGANDDGAEGMKLIRELGGVCIAQAPDTTTFPTMPEAAIRRAGIETVLPPREIGAALAALGLEVRAERPLAPDRCI